MHPAGGGLGARGLSRQVLLQRLDGVGVPVQSRVGHRLCQANTAGQFLVVRRGLNLGQRVQGRFILLIAQVGESQVVPIRLQNGFRCQRGVRRRGLRSASGRRQAHR